VSKSDLYDALFKEGQEIFKDNPCNIHRADDGVIECLHGRGSMNGTWCCEGCEHLTKDGCSVESLGCKLWGCSYANNAQTLERERPDIMQKLYLLRNAARGLNIPMDFRASKEQNFRWMKEPPKCTP